MYVPYLSRAGGTAEVYAPLIPYVRFRECRTPPLNGCPASNHKCYLFYYRYPYGVGREQLLARDLGRIPFAVCTNVGKPGTWSLACFQLEKFHASPI
jgi:hypothetical protein